MLLRTALALFIVAGLPTRADGTVPSAPSEKMGDAHDEDKAAVDTAPQTHPVTGTWHLATPKPELDQTIDTAVNTVASEFNLLIRELARAKLKGATKVCSRYRLDVQDTRVEFSCDDKTPVHLLRDGTPLHIQNEAGEPVRGTVVVKSDAVEVRWKGEFGERINTFRRTDDIVYLTATVSSSQTPTPLAWTVRYAPR